MISTLLSGNASYAGRLDIDRSFTNYNHYTFLSTLGGMAKMASLSNEEDENKIKGGARMTAKVIQIRYQLMRSLMKELQDPKTNFMPPDIQYGLTQIKSTLIQLLSQESLGHYTKKQNLHLQASVEKITEELQLMTIDAAALATETHHSLLHSISKGKPVQND